MYDVLQSLNQSSRHQPVFPNVDPQAPTNSVNNRIHADELHVSMPVLPAARYFPRLLNTADYNLIQPIYPQYLPSPIATRYRRSGQPYLHWQGVRSEQSLSLI